MIVLNQALSYAELELHISVMLTHASKVWHFQGGVELRSEQFRMFLNLFGATGSPPQEDAGSASSENQGSDPSTETAGASSG